MTTIDPQASKDEAVQARYQLRRITDQLDRQCTTLVSWHMPEREPSWVVGRPSPLLTDAEQAAVVREYAHAMGVAVTSWPFRRGTISLVATGGYEGGVTVQVVAEPLRDPNVPAAPAIPAPDPAEAAGPRDFTNDTGGDDADPDGCADSSPPAAETSEQQDDAETVTLTAVKPDTSGEDKPRARRRTRKTTDGDSEPDDEIPAGGAR